MFVCISQSPLCVCVCVCLCVCVSACVCACARVCVCVCVCVADDSHHCDCVFTANDVPFTLWATVDMPCRVSLGDERNKMDPRRETTFVCQRASCAAALWAFKRGS